jgi:hypothetical protein
MKKLLNICSSISASKNVSQLMQIYLYILVMKSIREVITTVLFFVIMLMFNYKIATFIPITLLTLRFQVY